MIFSFSCILVFGGVLRSRFILCESENILCFRSIRKRNYLCQKKKKSSWTTCKACCRKTNLPHKFYGMNYSERTEESPRCLECGDEIGYGRKGKKFCSEECRHKHHNEQHRSSRRYRRMVCAILDRNYEILNGLLLAGVESIWVADAIALGFNPAYVTSYRSHGKRIMCHCYDISYVTTDNRMTSISKIQNLSVTLQDISKRKR